MQVRWSMSAAEDLEGICAWIERDNPEAARRVAKTIYFGCFRLGEFPNMGRESRVPGYRELIFPPLPYIVIYKAGRYAVEISRIFHASQDWP